MKLKRTATFAGALLLAAASGPAGAALMGIYSQGFEADTVGWFDQANGWSGDIERVPSGTNGIASSAGSFHATAEQGSGTGPFSNFANSNSNTDWPGGIVVSLDIYLDTGWALGEGFDYSTAISDSAGDHRRDFIFHVTKDTSTGDLLVGGSNNTNFDPREDLEFLNHFLVATSGWYTFQHVFRDDGGILAVDLNLLNSGGSVLFTETRSTPADTIATTGGARYSWLTNIDIAGGIAIDEHQLSHQVTSPATLALLGLGLAGLGLRRARAT